MSRLGRETAMRCVYELDDLDKVLAAPAVGALAYAEVEELRRLVLKYPDKAKRILDDVGVPKQA